ncbi:MerR family transcriptional regulator [Aurantimonas aggregata]|uniref:MerR family transcriptional regulator n=1 Tax=Aurantimonas aggregata TaxID=2047720 RepID=A0A6L9MGL1_9HYPH|nr:MerR family transcriptional regulator [Aurantimonas aggregata]NDV86927.1 MerR family transcriptional regulator [Aurantimonas aggregata]
MTDKSVDAFRTISEVADDLDLPQHVLRFWETRFPQIKPMKRGGGRRYYRPDDVELLRGIRYLLYVKGFTIKGVQRILKENGHRFVVAIGSGDTGAIEQIQAGRSAAPAPTDAAPGEVHLDDIDIIAAEPRQMAAVDPGVEAERKPSKSFAGLLRRDPAAQAPSSGLTREAAKALDDVVIQLLECKRLLDQVR